MSPSGDLDANRPVPFRLTPNMAEFLTSTGVTGPLTAAMVSAARCFVQPQYKLASLLRAVLRDEYITWHKKVRTHPKLSLFVFGWVCGVVGCVWVCGCVGAVCVGVPACICICTRVCVSMYAYTCIHNWVHICMHINMHLHFLVKLIINWEKCKRRNLTNRRQN